MTVIEEVKAIYVAYPRHLAPRAAYKAIQKAAERLVKEKAQPDEHTARRWLWKRTAQYAKSPAGQPPPIKNGPDFRPYPATWFNAGHYDSDPSEWQKPNGAGHGSNASNGRHSKGDRNLEVLAASLRGADHQNGAHTNSHAAGRRGINPLFDLDDGEVIDGTP